MDSVVGCKGSKAALVVLTERLTRYPVIFWVPDHTMESVVRALDRLERRMGAKFRQVFHSITVDNGCEFQDCAGMERSKRARKPRTKIYYCHPYSAYERGSNENMNRIIRRFFPKGTNFDDVTAAEVAQVEEWLANYPRRILDWATPQMLYDEHMATGRVPMCASTYPKSTKYGRQNLITARWNSEEQLVLWRAAWADAVNLCLERSGHEERIDHRSHAERGLDDQPTIHEGVAARAMEKKGIISDRCELNRQVKADNALLREMKALVKKLTDAATNTVSAIAEAMETVRQKMIIFRYQLLHIRAGKKHFIDTLQVVQPDIKQYETIFKQLKAKIREHQGLLAEKKTVPTLQVFRYRELVQKIAGLTEEIEELKSEKALLLNQFNCANDQGMTAVKQRIASMESSLEMLNQQENKYATELDTALAQYIELQQQMADMNVAELDAARQAIQLHEEHKVMQQLQDTYGKRFDAHRLSQSRKDVAGLLDETSRPASIHQKLLPLYEQQEKPHLAKGYDQER